MSGAAEECVKACTHPQVTRVARDLLAAIARLIPEGQTTTPQVSMATLATEAQLHRRTVWTWLPVLVAIGELRVVEGKPGRRARYTLVQVSGAPPPEAQPLPLRAGLQPVPERPRSRHDDATPDLFTEPTPVRSPSEGRGFVRQMRDRITGWITGSQVAARADHKRSDHEETCDPRSQVGPFVRSDSEEPVIGTCDPVIGTCDPGDRLNTARDVHTTQNVHTHPAREDEPAADATTTTDAPRLARPGPRHPWHAWCPPPRTTGVCVPQRLHEDWLTKGHDAAWLFAFYARTCAALPAGTKVAVNDFTFWRAALQAELPSAAPAPARASTPRPSRAPIPDNDLFARAAAERRQKWGRP
jgi:hypothetical protein